MEDGFVIPAIIFAVFLVSGWLIVKWANQKKVFYNEKEIILNPTFGSRKLLALSDINEIKFNENFETIVIKDGKNQVSVDLQVEGFSYFIEFLKRNFSELSTDAISKMQEFRRKRNR